MELSLTVIVSVEIAVTIACYVVEAVSYAITVAVTRICKRHDREVKDSVHCVD